jgi:hypothetical protein
VLRDGGRRKCDIAGGGAAGRSVLAVCSAPAVVDATSSDPLYPNVAAAEATTATPWPALRRGGLGHVTVISVRTHRGGRGRQTTYIEETQVVAGAVAYTPQRGCRPVDISNVRRVVHPSEGMLCCCSGILRHDPPSAFTALGLCCERSRVVVERGYSLNFNHWTPRGKLGCAQRLCGSARAGGRGSNG